MDSLSHSLSADGGAGDDAATGQRGRGRDSLFLTATVTLPGDPASRSVRVRNLSEGGLMIECERGLAVGTPLVLGLRGIGEIAGRVAWCAEGRIGVALDRPIDPKRVRKPVGGGKPVPTNIRPLFG